MFLSPFLNPICGALFSREMREFPPLTPFFGRVFPRRPKFFHATVSLVGRCIFLFMLFLNGSASQAADAVNVGQPGSFSSRTGTNNEAELALKRFRVAPGLKVELFAAEPLLTNPVSFAFDEKGRVFVVETYRRQTSVYEIDRHFEWLDADLSFRTVEDRANFFKKVLVPENKSLPAKIIRDLNGDGKFDYHDLEVESERLRLLEDRNGDGRADTAVTYAEDFKTLVSGVASGVLVRHTNVWFACLPDLWLLRDTNGDGQADFRKPLLHGFGVHIASGAHALHGLRLGPGGKIYFSMGDRGFNVTSNNRTLAAPDSGAVLRCNPDGSECEIFASGLRNPQELAFDQYGNLWTGDNNADGGDKARWVYVVEGSESGWQYGWQYLPKLGAWNSERLWELNGTNTAAYILPPVAHIGHGPAGLAFYPGTGLPPAYDHHFLMCDFPGGVNSFALRPKGAAYEVIDLKEFLGELWPVDVDFGPDGGAYVADWVQGWEKPGKGRIYRVADPAVAKDPAVREVKKLLAEGFEKKSLRELTRFLEHKDMRVRLEAQFALAEKKADATNRLVAAALKNDSQLARLHAIWALGQIGRSLRSARSHLLPLLNDPDPEVRAQSAKVLGDARFEEAYEPLVKMLQDSHPRVRMFAALGVGKLGHQEATEPIFHLLRQNADEDPFLRHAGVMALVWLNDMNALVAAAKDSAPAVRLAVLLAMRRLSRPEIAMFLYDAKPALVLEAARAIYDLPIPSAFSQLASLISRPGVVDAAMRRVLCANFRVGNLENALALAEFAARPERPEALRTEALQLLGQWAKPPLRDPIVGLLRPLAPRDSRGASLALRSPLPEVLRHGTDALRIAAAQTAVQLEMGSVTPELFALLADKKLSPGVRLEFLKALSSLKDSRLLDAVALALADPSELLRKEAGQLLAKLKPADAISQVVTALEKGTMGEKQSALNTLASLDQPIADQVIASWLDLLQAGQVPTELQLDLLEAAAKRSGSVVKAKLQQYEAGRAQAGPLAGYRESLLGGDAQTGKAIFFARADAACLRCHKIKGEGGDVGPDLTGIGSKKTRGYLLESILDPNKEIAAGYENLLVKLKNGASFAGRWKNETEKELLLISAEDGLVVLSKSQIQSREKGLSPMPTGLEKILSKRDLRNLVEFLAGLK